MRGGKSALTGCVVERRRGAGVAEDAGGGGGDQRAIGAQGPQHGVERSLLGGDRVREVLGMTEGGVDRGVGIAHGLGPVLRAREISDPLVESFGGGPLVADEARDLMALGKQSGGDARAEIAGRAGEEDVHGEDPSDEVSRTICARRLPISNAGCYAFSCTRRMITRPTIPGCPAAST